MSKNISSTFFIIIFTATALYCCAKELYDFTVYRVDCVETNPDLIQNFTCFTKSKSRLLKLHYIYVTFMPNVKLSNMFVHVQYFYKYSSIYRPTLIHGEEDFCGFVNGTNGSKLIAILWPFLKERSNINHTCPYSGFVNVSGLEFPDTYMPPVLPSGESRIDIFVRDGPKRIPVIKVRFFVQIKAKGAANLDMK